MLQTCLPLALSSHMKIIIKLLGISIFVSRTVKEELRKKSVEKEECNVEERKTRRRVEKRE
jgi:hypothetical protein